MKKTLRLAMIFMLFFLSAVLTGCGNKTAGNANIKDGEKTAVTGDTAWKFDNTIATPITGRSTASDDLTLGKLDENKVSVEIPKGAFDADTDLKLQNPVETPNVVGNDVKVIGAPIEIAVDKPVRLNEPVKITFAFDKTLLTADTPASELRVVYYDGNGWETIRPDSVDTEKGLASFTTFHFSLFGLNQIEKKTKLTEEWIHSKTLDEELKDNLNKMSDHVTNQIIDLTLQKMGLNDKEIKTKVLADVLKDDGYKKIYDAYEKGDQDALNQKIALLAGKKIAAIVPASTLQAGLKEVVGSAKDIEAVSKAAGNIAEGRYEDAARIIGEEITDKFLIGKAGKIAVEVINYEIGAWKNAEVEAAYNAYKDGANGKFWGYNVDKNDFDGVWDQMRGIRRQLEIEAIAKENAVRHDSDMAPMTEAQMDMVRAGIKESFRKQFAERQTREDEFKKQEDALRKLVDGFDKADFFGSTAPVGLDKGFDYENKLDVLYHFAQKIMADTKRSELTDLNGLLVDGKISVDDVVQGARFWFSGPDGRKQYAKFLKDRFNVSLAPGLKDLAGNWPTGKLLFKDVVLTPETIAKIEEQKNKPKDPKSLDSGCDFTIDPREFKGKEVPLTAVITASGEDKGTINLNMKDGKVDPMSFTYNEGEIKASMTKQGATGNLDLNAADGDNAYTADGSLNISFDGGQILIDISLSKPKQAPVSTPPVK